VGAIDSLTFLTSTSMEGCAIRAREQKWGAPLFPLEVHKMSTREAPQPSNLSDCREHYLKLDGPNAYLNAYRSACKHRATGISKAEAIENLVPLFEPPPVAADGKLPSWAKEAVCEQRLERNIIVSAIQDAYDDKPAKFDLARYEN
jgi:hypothetical protein